MSGRDVQSVIRKRLFIPFQLLQIHGHRFSGRLEETPQFWSNIEFPFAASSFSLEGSGRTEQPFFRRGLTFRVGTDGICRRSSARNGSSSDISSSSSRGGKFPYQSIFSSGEQMAPCNCCT
jgi:hypothetical protein